MATRSRRPITLGLQTWSIVVVVLVLVLIVAMASLLW